MIELDDLFVFQGRLSLRWAAFFIVDYQRIRFDFKNKLKILYLKVAK